MISIKLYPKSQSFKVIIDSEGEPPPPSLFDKFHILSNFDFYIRQIDQIILNYLKDSTRVVHGAKAMNIQLPTQFRRPTYDWDIYSRSAFKDADKIEDLLDNIFHRDVFYTVKMPLSENPKKTVYRVINRITGRAVADFMYRRDMPPHIIVGGVRYATLLYLKRKLENILRNPRAKHRWAKAKADLERINKAIEYMRERLGR